MTDVNAKPLKGFHLVQALHTPMLMSMLHQRRFGEIFVPKYMGAAQYEGGAFDRYICSLSEAIDASPALIETFEIKIAGAQLCGIFDTRKCDLETVRAGIKSLLDGTAQLKRPADFPPRTNPPSVAWAEINLGVFWSLADYRAVIPGMIHREAQYLNSLTAGAPA